MQLDPSVTTLRRHATEAVTHRLAGFVARGLLCRKRHMLIGSARAVLQSGQRTVPRAVITEPRAELRPSCKRLQRRGHRPEATRCGRKAATTWRRTIPSLDDARAPCPCQNKSMQPQRLTAPEVGALRITRSSRLLAFRSCVLSLVARRRWASSRMDTAMTHPRCCSCE